MSYTTIQYNGVEKSLADWGVSTWRREVLNQAGDSFAFNLVAAADAAEIFPYGAMLTVRINRSPASVPNPNLNPNPSLPVTGVTAWSGGSTWFVGWRVQNLRSGSAALEQLQYKFAGPWELFFDRLVFQKLWLTWNGTKQIADWRSQVVLGLSVNTLTGAGDTVTGTTATNLMSVAQQIKEITAYVTAQSGYEQTVNGLGWPSGAQFQFDALTADSGGNYYLLTTMSGNLRIPDFVPGHAGASGDTSASTSGILLRAPLDAVNDITCAEAMRKMLRWIGTLGGPVLWFDYATSPPTLKVSARDQLNAVTLPFTGSTQSVKIQRRDDLIPSAVHLKYRISGQIFGSPYTVVENDIAAVVDSAAVEGVGQFGALTSLAGGAISSAAQTQLPLQARRFAAQVGTFDFEGVSASGATAAIATLAASYAVTDPSASSPAKAFWTYHFPELANSAGLQFYNSGNPAPTVLDDNGSAVDLTQYPYILLDGQIAPWMYVNNTPTSNTPGAAIEATLTAYFSAQETAPLPSGDSPALPFNPSSQFAYQEKHVRVKLTNLAGGVYTSAPEIAAGEPVPYGLAGYIFSQENIPQYEGTLVLMEQEISDPCPVGSALNISGGLAEWATMNAVVQQVTYDDTGRTQITFGPPQHLGAGDVVERLRVNRGPRWLNLIGRDILNNNPQSGPIQLGGYVPKHAPTTGTTIETAKTYPANLKDWEQYGYFFPPGVNIYTSSITPRPGASADAGPGLYLQTGSAGSIDPAWVLISIAQLKAVVSGQPVQFTEYGPFCVDGVSKYFTALGTALYTK